MAYDIMVLGQTLSELGRHAVEVFSADHVLTWEAAHNKLPDRCYRALVWDALEQSSVDWEACQAFLANNPMDRIPLVLLAPVADIETKLKAFEMGCDDYIDPHSSTEETCARINKAIYHRIAADQLNQRLAYVTETVRTTMVDNSDLGATIQFLLQIHQCDNLDQLGQQFFASIRRYGLRCSLQMRSRTGVKDMEAHGMAKDLESQLLMQLKDSGRFVDFGRRTVINYERVSLLIKNMPQDNHQTWDAIRENIFRLVQGINARVMALEQRGESVREKQAVTRLETEVQATLQTVLSTYQEAMKTIAMEVGSAAERIQHRLPHLALAESDEAFMERIAEDVVVQTNRIAEESLARLEQETAYLLAKNRTNFSQL